MSAVIARVRLFVSWSIGSQAYWITGVGVTPTIAATSSTESLADTGENASGLMMISLIMLGLSLMGGYAYRRYATLFNQ